MNKLMTNILEFQFLVIYPTLDNTLIEHKHCLSCDKNGIKFNIKDGKIEYFSRAFYKLTNYGSKNFKDGIEYFGRTSDELTEYTINNFKNIDCSFYLKKDNEKLVISDIKGKDISLRIDTKGKETKEIKPYSTILLKFNNQEHLLFAIKELFIVRTMTKEEEKEAETNLGKYFMLAAARGELTVREKIND